MVVSGVEVKADSPCPPASSAIFPDQGTPVARIHLLKSQQTQKLLFYFKKKYVIVICDVVGFSLIGLWEIYALFVHFCTG